MRKIREIGFHASNPQHEMAVTMYPDGDTVISSIKPDDSFAFQVKAPGLADLIKKYPVDARWTVLSENIPSAVRTSIRDHRVIVLQARDYPPLVAFCTRRITKAAADALLVALPSITAVACSEGLITRSAST